MEQIISSVLPEEKPMGGASKVFNIFFEPKKVFESLKIKPTWLVPFLIVSILGIGSFYFTYPFMMKQQVEKIRENERIPDEQKQAIIEKMTEQNHPPLWQLPFAPVGVLFVFAILSAVLFFVFNVLLGGDSTFRRVFSVYCYSNLIAIAAMIVKFPLIMMKKDLGVQTSLALLLSADSKDTFLYRILSGFDIFNLWQVILVSIGLGVLYRYTTKKAFTVVFVLWILLILGMSGLSSLFGGMFSL
jgi:hypothetical protein